MDGLGVSSQPEVRLADGVPALGDRAGVSEPGGRGAGTGEWGLYHDAGLSIGEHHAAVRERSGHVYHWRFVRDLHRRRGPRGVVSAPIRPWDAGERLWHEPGGAGHPNGIHSPPAADFGWSFGNGQRDCRTSALRFADATEHSDPLRDRDRYGSAGRQQQRARGYLFVYRVGIGSGAVYPEPAGTGPITATSSGGRGQEFALYVTGAGEVSPPIATGAVPTGTQVPVPLLAVSVTVGGVAAHLDYVGLPSWSVGTLQVNFTVPPNAPLGAQSVVVTVGSASSPAAATFTVQ